MIENKVSWPEFDTADLERKVRFELSRAIWAWNQESGEHILTHSDLGFILMGAGAILNMMQYPDFVTRAVITNLAKDFESLQAKKWEK